MIGQDAVRTATSFNERIDLDGVILTKLDGDARGGAALSIRQVTGKPIKFVGMGEGLDRLEEFRPDGLASRILGFGDIVGLMKDFEEVADVEKAEKDAEKLLSGDFNFEDFIEQMKMIQKMGPLQEVFDKMPMLGDMVPKGTKVDDRELVKIEAICNSMTRSERQNPDILGDSRVQRVASGSGHSRKEVKGLLDRFKMARVMMREMGKATGLMGKVPGLRQAQGLARLRRQGLNINPSMLSSLQNMAGADALGLGGGGGSQQRRSVDASKKKALRKKARKARKKNKRR